MVQLTSHSWVLSIVLDSTFLKNCLWEIECCPSSSGHPLHRPNIQLKACRDKELKGSIPARSCARIHLAKSANVSCSLVGEVMDQNDGDGRWLPSSSTLCTLTFCFSNTTLGCF